MSVIDVLVIIRNVILIWCLVSFVTFGILALAKRAVQRGGDHNNRN